MTTILIADDDHVIRQMLKRIFHSIQFETVLAENGIQALEEFQRQPKEIDLVLLDVQMPQLDGVRTLQCLKKIDPNTCICMMSGGLGEYTFEDCFRSGATRIFRKPFDIAELLAQIRELVADHHAKKKIVNGQQFDETFQLTIQ
jgi:DNA-binding response OmpR family regulator